MATTNERVRLQYRSVTASKRLEIFLNSFAIMAFLFSAASAMTSMPHIVTFSLLFTASGLIMAATDSHLKLYPDLNPALSRRQKLLFLAWAMLNWALFLWSAGSLAELVHYWVVLPLTLVGIVFLLLRSPKS